MIFEHIANCPVLKGIDPEKIKEIFNDVSFKIKVFDKDNLVLISGEPCENLMILISGQVRGEVLDFKGEIVKIEDISAPRPIAPAFLFGKQNKYPVTVIANTKTQILYIPKNELLKIFQKDTNILQNYLDIISSRGQFLVERVKLLTLKTLKQRIAFYILQNITQLPLKNYTQKEMSETLGVTRPSLARAFIKMEEEKILSYNKGRIIIINELKLKQILQF